MAKKNIHHSIHWTEEVDAIAHASMKEVGIAKLNRYVEFLVLRHDELLRACQTSAEIADKWRKLLRTMEEKE